MEETKKIEDVLGGKLAESERAPYLVVVFARGSSDSVHFIAGQADGHGIDRIMNDGNGLFVLACCEVVARAIGMIDKEGEDEDEEFEDGYGAYLDDDGEPRDSVWVVSRYLNSSMQKEKDTIGSPFSLVGASRTRSLRPIRRPVTRKDIEAGIEETIAELRRRLGPRKGALASWIAADETAFRRWFMTERDRNRCNQEGDRPMTRMEAGVDLCAMSSPPMPTSGFYEKEKS